MHYSLSLNRTDFIFHAVDEDGNIVDFDELLQKLDVGAFFNAILECEPVSISVRAININNAYIYNLSSTYFNRH